MDELIKKHFKKHDINFDDKHGANYVDDTYDSLKNAITEICKEYTKEQLKLYGVVNM